MIGIGGEGLVTIGWGVLSIICLTLFGRQPTKKTYLRCSCCCQDHGEYICCECATQVVGEDETVGERRSTDRNFPLPIPDSIYRKPLDEYRTGAGEPSVGRVKWHDERRTTRGERQKPVSRFAHELKQVTQSGLDDKEKMKTEMKEQKPFEVISGKSIPGTSALENLPGTRVHRELDDKRKQTTGIKELPTADPRAARGPKPATRSDTEKIISGMKGLPISGQTPNDVNSRQKFPGTSELENLPVQSQREMDDKEKMTTGTKGLAKEEQKSVEPYSKKSSPRTSGRENSLVTSVQRGLDGRDKKTTGIEGVPAAVPRALPEQNPVSRSHSGLSNENKMIPGMKGLPAAEQKSADIKSKKPLPGTSELENGGIASGSGREQQRVTRGHRDSEDKDTITSGMKGLTKSKPVEVNSRISLPDTSEPVTRPLGDKEQIKGPKAKLIEVNSRKSLQEISGTEPSLIPTTKKPSQVTVLSEKRTTITSVVELGKRSLSPSNNMSPRISYPDTHTPVNSSSRSSMGTIESRISSINKINNSSEQSSISNVGFEDESAFQSRKSSRRSSGQTVEFYPTQLSTISEVPSNLSEPSQGTVTSERTTTIKTRIELGSGSITPSSKASTISASQQTSVQEVAHDMIRVCQRSKGSGEKEEVSFKGKKSTVTIVDCPARKKPSIPVKARVSSSIYFSGNHRTLEHSSGKSPESSSFTVNNEPDSKRSCQKSITFSDKPCTGPLTRRATVDSFDSQTPKQKKPTVTICEPLARSVHKSPTTSSLSQDSETSRMTVTTCSKKPAAKGMEAVRLAPKASAMSKRIHIGDAEKNDKYKTEESTTIYRYSTEYREYKHLHRQKKHDRDMTSSSSS